MAWGALGRPGPPIRDKDRKVPTVPTDIADTPTIGAWRRAHHHTQWSPEAQHLFAVTIATEAQRSILTDRLDSIALFLENGATPDQAIARLTALLTEWHGR